MADYCCTIRTNYFKVKDDLAFQTFMERVYGWEDSIEVWSKIDSDGTTRFAFGCYGGIAGLKGDDYGSDDYDEDDYNFDAFIDGLIKHVAEDDAILIMESGNEKMRYVIGSVTVITSKGYEYREISDVGVNMARQMLGNDDWETQIDY